MSDHPAGPFTTTFRFYGDNIGQREDIGYCELMAVMMAAARMGMRTAKEPVHIAIMRHPSGTPSLFVGQYGSEI